MRFLTASHTAHFFSAECKLSVELQTLSSAFLCTEMSNSGQREVQGTVTIAGSQAEQRYRTESHWLIA